MHYRQQQQPRSNSFAWLAKIRVALDFNLQLYFELPNVHRLSKGSREYTMSWDGTRRQVRSLETKLDAALNQYSRLAANIAGAASAWPGTDVEEGRKAVKDENVGLEQEIEAALTEVSTSCERQ